MLLVLALLAMAVSNTLSAKAVARSQELAEHIEASAECRFDRNAKISNINDLIDLWTARGLAATVRSDDEQVQVALLEIDSLSAEFEQVIAERSRIAEDCSDQ